mmetsp:Transcript_67097/g.143570  ORF Transcript_67097/g.143570 Transcript_67097/m.143570 type:complete len:230 (-) Transcript_67097:333-1022(-)
MALVRHGCIFCRPLCHPPGEGGRQRLHARWSNRAMGAARRPEHWRRSSFRRAPGKHEPRHEPCKAEIPCADGAAPSRRGEDCATAADDAAPADDAGVNAAGTDTTASANAVRRARSPVRHQLLEVQWACAAPPVLLSFPALRPGLPAPCEEAEPHEGDDAEGGGQEEHGFDEAHALGPQRQRRPHLCRRQRQGCRSAGTPARTPRLLVGEVHREPAQLGPAYEGAPILL